MFNQVFERKALRASFSNKPICEFLQTLAAIAAVRYLKRVGAHKCSHASTRLNQPRTLQLLVGFGYSIRVDAQINGQLASGGQLIPDA